MVTVPIFLAWLVVGVHGAIDQEADIRGPLGPMDFAAQREAGHAAAPRQKALRRALAGALAVGFAVVAVGFLVHRRRRIGRGNGAAGPTAAGLLVEDADRLGAAEFYGRLLAIVRQSLTTRMDIAAGAMTPRELGRLELPAPGEAEEADAGGLSRCERWRQLCARAELAEYAGTEIGPAQREEDLEFALRLVRQVGAGKASEAADEL